MTELTEAEREGLIEAVQAGTEAEWVEAILSARLAKVEALANGWERCSARIREATGDLNDGVEYLCAAADLRAALSGGDRPVSGNERDTLTEVLAAHGMPEVKRMPKDGAARFVAYYYGMAEAVLASDWLAAHEARAVEQALADERAKVVVVLDALDRTESRFRKAVAGKPVRDMAETLAENANARQIALTTAVESAQTEAT